MNPTKAAAAGKKAAKGRVKRPQTRAQDARQDLGSRFSTPGGHPSKAANSPRPITGPGENGSERQKIKARAAREADFQVTQRSPVKFSYRCSARESSLSRFTSASRLLNFRHRVQTLDLSCHFNALSSCASKDKSGQVQRIGRLLSPLFAGGKAPIPLPESRPQGIVRWTGPFLGPDRAGGGLRGGFRYRWSSQNSKSSGATKAARSSV